jgi:DNA mismatch repair protein MutH
LTQSKFDPKKKSSILSYAERLEGASLQASFVREGLAQTRPDGSHWGLRRRNAGEGSKGGFGAAVQEGYFGLELDNRPEPDFEEAALELKTTPLIQRKSGKWVPKERLKITAINYHSLHAYAFEESRVARKADDILIVFYLDEKGVENPLQLYVDRVINWGFGYAPAEVMQVIRDDYDFLRNKVAAGLAHEISGGDTQYLEALTSGSGKMRSQPCSATPAKERSFALKHSLLRMILKGHAARLPRVSNPTGEAVALVRQHLGRTAESLRLQYGAELNPTAKSLPANVIHRILGKDLKAALSLGEIKVVNVRCGDDWMPDQNVSFPKFSFASLYAEDDWYTSSCRQQMERRMLFVIWRKGATLGDSVLLGTFWWTIPQVDLEGPVQQCWRTARSAISACDGSRLPGTKGSTVAHVRPHGQNSKDVDTFPDGSTSTKRCFWLNKSYLKSVIEAAADRGDLQPLP